MKKFYLLAILVSCFVFTNAQGTFKFGIAGGANIADISSKSDSKFLPGFHAGLKSEIKLPVKLGIEIDALYSLKGASYEYSKNAKTEQADFKMAYIDIPVIAKIYTLKVVSLQLGPQVSYLLSAKYDGVDVKETLNSIDLGAVAGLGLDVSKFNAAIRYNLGLTEISDGSGKNKVIQVSLGFWIK